MERLPEIKHKTEAKTKSETVSKCKPWGDTHHVVREEMLLGFLKISRGREGGERVARMELCRGAMGVPSLTQREWVDGWVPSKVLGPVSARLYMTEATGSSSLPSFTISFSQFLCIMNPYLPREARCSLIPSSFGELNSHRYRGHLVTLNKDHLSYLQNNSPIHLALEVPYQSQGYPFNKYSEHWR